MKNEIICPKCSSTIVDYNTSLDPWTMVIRMECECKACDHDFAMDGFVNIDWNSLEEN